MTVRLDQLLHATRERLAERKRERPLVEFERSSGARVEGRPFGDSLS